MSPIITAKSMGPAKSPMVLERPRPSSAKVEAHWLIACSQEPAQNSLESRVNVLEEALEMILTGVVA